MRLERQKAVGRIRLVSLANDTHGGNNPVCRHEARKTVGQEKNPRGLLKYTGALGVQIVLFRPVLKR